MAHTTKHRNPKRRNARQAKPLLGIAAPEVGRSPGTFTVHPEAKPSRLRVMAYGPEGLAESDTASVHRVEECLRSYPVTWICVEGLGDEKLLRKLSEMFSLHALSLEDALNPESRTKAEFYESHAFVVAREICRNECLQSRQVSVFWGEGYVLTLHEEDSVLFDPLRARIRGQRGRHKTHGPDYLAYTVLDVVVDAYFVALEAIAQRIDATEERIFGDPDPSVMESLHEIRHELLSARRAVRPMRDVINELERDTTPFVTDETKVYLRDCYDHALEAVELLEVYRDLSASLLESYMTLLSTATNDIMRVLTLISSIFIPLSFIAGVYGMNFHTGTSPYNMPELGWRFGYPLILSVMLGAGLMMFAFFARKGWLRSTAPRPRKAAHDRRGKRR